jgi:hypothetical protein
VSYNVLIIPEDFTHDQYMLKPIVEAVVEAAGRPNANVRVCRDPLLGGVSQALQWDNLDDILDRYRMVDLFVLCVDRDGEDGRRAVLDRLEQQAAGSYPNQAFLAEQAWQEIEVWVLAGHTLPREWSWQDVRAHRDPKETYYVPFAQSAGVAAQPSAGRKRLAQTAKYKTIRNRCPEVKDLETRIAALL